MKDASARKRLLIVDDEAGFRDFVKEAAADLGFDVDSASNGSKAREIYGAFQPNVILLDIVMPEVDGIEFLRWLAQQQTASRVILVSGYNPYYAESATKLAEALGLFDITFLAKPVRLNTLAEALREQGGSSEAGRTP